ncbi:Arylsulfatase [Anatilimnocola aggregata]|uniref:Arylsulfatase n=1 Tax=Anatilimnocola aggregata TaxID=2528021 RepID=A0A517YID4_9BACT|nr:sulfatase-like hydrolase/transferase [Anatilimnocola aggregata]QDU29972.1 Arylsulfatase [Anatilimnocola aggregata]
MRFITVCWSALLLLLLVATGEMSRAAENARPNVVIFLADDAGWGDYSRNGNKSVATPHIDSLAANGVTLDRFFVCPVCAPTRAEFLTGRYHPRTGVYGVSTGQERMNLDERTIADAFQAAGYATGAFGKWHNGSQWPYHPMARGFDEYYGYTSGHWGEYFDPPLEHNGQPVREKGYIVDICTTAAIKFIERNAKQPFFCYVPFTTPHSPWAVPEQNWQRFKEKPITQRGTQSKQENLDETRCALAMIQNQDENVGRVLSKLDELKLADNTIVLYFSDNGPNSWRWNGEMKGRKGSTDEGGVRSTCYWRWPAKLPKDRTISGISGAIDLLPTLCTLAGIERVGDKPLDGQDLSPYLMETKKVPAERMIFSTWGRNVSVRTNQYRLDNAGQLFDLVADPSQTKAVNDQQQGTVDRLAATVQAWRIEMGFDVTPGAPSGNKRKSVDPRPIPVGYREFPRTWLPARDGEPVGSVKRSSGAPNSSYFVNWKSKEDSLVWEIDVNTTGNYAVELRYTCPLAAAGSTIELTFLKQTLSGKVMPGWDPLLYTNQETLPRPPAESKMKEFRPLKLGTIHLERGRGPLTLQASDIPGSEVMDLLEVTLTLLDR